MTHRPVEEMGRSISENGEGEGHFEVVSQRFVQVENVSLMRQPKGRHVAHVVIVAMKVKDDGVAFI